MTPTTNDVEPTTSATDELCRLLDERGVEHEGSERSVRWRDRNGVMMQAFPLADGELGMEVWSCTPEQAIAATLGSCNCSNNCTNSERTGTFLPHFWTHDGTLHIEATRMPTRIVVCEGGTCEFVPKRELDASEAENAKLREENQSIGLAAYELGRKSMADENAKLREELEQWHRLTAGIELPEYPITEFKPKDLERENAKLRDELDAAKHDLSLFSGRIVELGAENAKLRELVRDLWEFFCVVPEDEPHVFKEELEFSVEVWRRMRELGVEVDG